MRFDPEKVTEAAAFLLHLRGGRMHYIKLLKLLYIADRQAFAQWGIPITNDNYVSMDNGPVLSQTFNLIREGGRFWSEYISAQFGDYEIELNGTIPKARKLSIAEENILQQVFEAHGHKSRWDIVDYVHTFPEWQNPHGSSIPIKIEEILQALDVDEADIQAILAELQEDRKLVERLQACCA